jgi:diguanylate cyclase (GGDEF)-like protein/PAS domain S-box-containing protein
MKTFNTYYTNHKTLKNFIIENNIEDNKSLLIQIFTSLRKKYQIQLLLDDVNSLFKNAIVIGSTTDGEIMNGLVSTNKSVINFTQFKKTKLKAVAIKHIEDGYHSGRFLAQQLIKKDTKLLIALADGLYTNGQLFLEGIHSVNQNISVAGGLAGDGAKFKKTFIFTKEYIITKGAVGVSLSGKNLNIHTDQSFNWQPIGKELTITKAKDNIIYEIDNRSAVDIYKYYLGKSVAKRLPKIGIEFPLILYRNGLIIARAVLGKGDNGSLIFGANFKNGDKVYFGYGNAHKILNQSKEVFTSTQKSQPEAIFIYSCMARRRFMPKDIELETIPLQTIAPTTGLFTYGEFFTHTHKELLNQTMTLVALSEGKKRIKDKKKFILQKLNRENRSMDALVHLVNKVRDEIQLQVDILKGSEKLNKELKERMELALFGSKDGLWDWNILDDTIYFSPSWKEMIGFKDNELPNLKSSWIERIHPDDLDNMRENINLNIDGTTEYIDNIHRLKHKDGRWIWILERGKTLFNQDNKAIRTIGTHTDITQEKEKQLLFLKQAQIIDQIHDAVISTDLDGYITSWNKGATKLLFYLPEDVIGKHIRTIYLKEDYQIFEKHIKKLDKQGEYKIEGRLVKKTNNVMYTEMSLSLLHDENGKTIGRIGYCQDITQRKEAERNLIEQKNILHHQAHHDALTGLPNRKLFHQRLENGLKNAKKHNSKLALFFIDLDRFKQINDSLGHDVGDEVLNTISHRLDNAIDTKNTLARLGGDEFTIILNNITDVNTVSNIANKILKITNEPMVIGKHILYLSISIGVSLYPKDGIDAPSLLQYADAAMYKAKDEGRNTFQYYSSEMTQLALERVTMTTSLKQALENREFVLFYQPQIDAKKDIMVGMEALIRWQHPTMGLLSPNKFISLAEETGLIIDIDNWMIEMSIKQFKEWYDKGLNPKVLSINISFMQLEREEFLDILKDILKKYDFSPKWLELEITERQVMQKPKEAIKKLHQISQLGVAISIDDFGTEYSSLSYLKKLPINKLKIDRSFVKDIMNNKEDKAITKAIIILANNLGLDVISEGVETIEQKEFILSQGCNLMQGYYFSHPLDTKSIENKFLLK